MGCLLLHRHYQSGKFQKVFQTERRPASRDGYHWIRRNCIGPTGRNGCQPALLVMVIKDILTPVLPGGHQRQGPIAVRMEGMGDTEHSRLAVRIGCNRRRR